MLLFVQEMLLFVSGHVCETVNVVVCVRTRL